MNFSLIHAEQFLKVAQDAQKNRYMDFDIYSDRTEKEMSIKGSDVKTFFLSQSGSV